MEMANDAKCYSLEEVKKATLEYFGGDELATNVWTEKYCLKDNHDNLLEKTPDDTIIRIAKEFVRIEKSKFKNPMTFEEIYSYLDHFKYIVPAGSPLFGIGNDYQYVSLSNCFLATPPLDSYTSILKTDAQLIYISKRRGGVGIDISNFIQFSYSYKFNKGRNVKKLGHKREVESDSKSQTIGR